jgi:hypothetical protein
MTTSSIAHFVFVDFENVQAVDLGLVEGKPVHVTLLIGKKQTKLDLVLVQQMLRLKDQVGLVEVGASGHNALDLTLAFYLGRAVQRSPDAEFAVVSKDKDFDAMLSHLIGKGIKAVRRDSFAAAFQPLAKKHSTVSKPPMPIKKPAADRFEQLITSFKGVPQQRPKKRSTLLHHIATFYGNKLSEVEVADTVAKLEMRGAISIDDKDKVAYR